MCNLYKHYWNFLCWGVRGVTSLSPREITLTVVEVFSLISQGVKAPPRLSLGL